MATRQYNANKGGNYSTITQEVGGAITNGIELTIDLAKYDTKEQALLSLQALIEYITRDIWKPA